MANFPGSIYTNATPTSANYLDDAGVVHDVLHSASIGEVTAIETYLGTNASQTTPTGANSVLNSTSTTVATWTTIPTLVDVIITTPSNTAGHVATVDGTQTLSGKTLTTPNIGVATATTVNKVTITAPATGSTLTIADGKTLTVNNSLTLAGVDATTQTFQASDTIVGRATTDTLTNKTLTSPTITGTVTGQVIGATNLTTGAILLGNATSTTLSQSGITSQTDLTGLTVTVTVPSGGRSVLITCQVLAQSTVADDIAMCPIVEDGTNILQARSLMRPASNNISIGGQVLRTPTAGSHTYKLAGARVSGTGTITYGASASDPTQINVFLI